MALKNPSSSAGFTPSQYQLTYSECVWEHEWLTTTLSLLSKWLTTTLSLLSKCLATLPSTSLADLPVPNLVDIWTILALPLRQPAQSRLLSNLNSSYGYYGRKYHHSHKNVHKESKEQKAEVRMKTELEWGLVLVSFALHESLKNATLRIIWNIFSAWYISVS
jgi:hypothetical protein